MSACGDSASFHELNELGRGDLAADAPADPSGDRSPDRSPYRSNGALAAGVRRRARATTRRRMARELSISRRSMVRAAAIACCIGFASSVPARAGSEVARHRTENVILVTIDGLRWQEVFSGADESLMTKETGGLGDVDATKRAFWRDSAEKRREALMPFAWSTIASQGQIFGNHAKSSTVRVENGRNFSYPGYNELLTGAADPRIDSNDKKANPNTTVLEWLNAKPAFHGRVAAFCTWDVMPFILNRERSKLFVNAGLESVDESSLTDRQALLNRLQRETSNAFDHHRADSFTFQIGLEWLKKHKPRVVYFNFSETDEWAHAGRYDRVLEAAHEADAMLAELWNVLQSTDGYRGKTSLVVTTDHGRGDPPAEWKGHGAKVKGSELIWIAAIGPDTAALGERTSTSALVQGQVAATIAALLGEDYHAAVPGAAAPIAEILPAH
jgi:Type I phosphodiesterase / nucleotide pyrophosphatase